VSDSQHRIRTLPKLKPYLWIVGVLLMLWLGFVWIVQIKAQELNMELRDMNQVLRWGIAAILGPMMLIFSVHWWGKAVASEKAGLATYKANVMAQIAEQQATQARTCALEIRGVGLAVDGWQQSTIWRLVQKKNSNFSSIYSRNPNDYQASVTTRWNIQKINIRAAFKYSASESVAYWPIPVFALGPPDPYEKGYRAAGLINSGRNKATLGVTQFLWQDDESTTHAQGMIERLFQFFDDNPQVPQALIASRDGDVTRDVYRKPDRATGHGIDPGVVDEGYNIGRRLGNTGVSSALVEINLATIASYLDGGASAVVYAGADGSLTVQMIRPPDAARKEKNRENRGADPFKFGSPSGGAPRA
jgi:hypothetical protein